MATSLSHAQRPQQVLNLKLGGLSQWEDVEAQCRQLDQASLRVSSLTLDASGGAVMYHVEAGPDGMLLGEALHYPEAEQSPRVLSNLRTLRKLFSPATSLRRNSNGGDADYSELSPGACLPSHRSEGTSSGALDLVGPAPLRTERQMSDPRPFTAIPAYTGLEGEDGLLSLPLGSAHQEPATFNSTAHQRHGSAPVLVGQGQALQATARPSGAGVSHLRGGATRNLQAARSAILYDQSSQVRSTCHKSSAHMPLAVEPPSPAADVPPSTDKAFPQHSPEAAFPKTQGFAASGSTGGVLPSAFVPWVPHGSPVKPQSGKGAPLLSIKLAGDISNFANAAAPAWGPRGLCSGSGRHGVGGVEDGPCREVKTAEWEQSSSCGEEVCAHSAEKKAFPEVQSSSAQAKIVLTRETGSHGLGDLPASLHQIMLPSRAQASLLDLPGLQVSHDSAINGAVCPSPGVIHRSASVPQLQRVQDMEAVDGDLEQKGSVRAAERLLELAGDPVVRRFGRRGDPLVRRRRCQAGKGAEHDGYMCSLNTEQ